MAVQPAKLNGAAFERISFDSGYEPDPRLPGRDRWLAHERNRRARAWVVRSAPSDPRPWVVHLHPFRTGHANDVRMFRSFGYRDRGVNVIQPVFPLHGARRSGRRSGDGAVSFDAMATVHGFTQAIWDIRRCILWARGQGATAIGVHGISLGGYTAALLAGIEDGLACVIAGIAPSEILTLLARHAPPAHVTLSSRAGSSVTRHSAIHRVVSPLAFTPRVAHDRRFIYAGIGDRVSTAEQAHMLWQHWDRPEILWLPSGHVHATLMADVHRFVRRAIYATLLGEPEPALRKSEGA